MDNKKCLKCNKIKFLNQFNKNKSKKDNLDIYCKDCIKEKAKKYYNPYIALIAKDKINNKICIKCNKEKSKIDFSKNKNQKDGLYYYCKECNINSNKEKDWYKNQYNKNREYKRNWEHNKYNFDLNHKLKSNIRCRINSMLKKQKVYKNNSTLKYLGCTLYEYKNHIEKQLKKEWTWDNHGILWEVDHIIPCSSFDLNIEKNIFICFNYKNTQPLCKSENRSKKNKIYE
jgi:hypothetical protein